MNGILLQTNLTETLDEVDIFNALISTFTYLSKSKDEQYIDEKEAYLNELKSITKKLESARIVYLEALEKYNLGLSFEAYVKRCIKGEEDPFPMLRWITKDLEDKAYKINKDWKERAITNAELYSSYFRRDTTEEQRYISERKHIFDKGSGVISCDNKYLPIWLEYYNSLGFEPLIASIDNSNKKQVLWMKKREDALKCHINFSYGFYEFHEMEIEILEEKSKSK